MVEAESSEWCRIVSSSTYYDIEIGIIIHRLQKRFKAHLCNNVICRVNVVLQQVRDTAPTGVINLALSFWRTISFGISE